MKATEILYWLARLIATFIMMQTLYFKFTEAGRVGVYIYSSWYGAVGQNRGRRS